MAERRAVEQPKARRDTGDILRRATALFLFLALGCGEKNTVFVPAPEVGAAKAGLLAFLRAERIVELRALDLEAAPLDRQIATFESPVDRLELLLYDRSLSAMRLAPGSLSFLSDGEPLERPSQVLENKLSASWTSRSAMSAALAAMRVPTTEPAACAKFAAATVREIPLPVPELTRWIVAADDRSILAAQTSTISRVYADGTIEPLDRTLTPSSPAAAFRGREGELYFADLAGGVFRGDLAGDFTALSSAEGLEGATFAALDGNRTGDRSEELYYYLANEFGALIQRWSQGRWQRFATTNHEGGAYGFLWVEPGRILTFGKARGSKILLHGRDPAELEVSFAVGGHQLDRGRWTPFGIVFWSHFGALSMLGPGDVVTPLGGAALNNIRDATTFESGILFGGWSDAYRAYAGGRFCDIVSFRGSLDRTEILRVGDVYFMPHDSQTSPYSIGVLQFP